MMPARLALQERAHLHEAVVSPAQHSLRLLDRVDLPRPRLTPHVEVLEEEITRAVELRDVLTQGHQVTSRPLVVLRGLVEVTLEAGLLGLLLRDGLAVTRPLLRAVRHQLLVVLLRILLLHVVSLHLHLQVVRQLLDQRSRATGVLLLVRALSRRRRSHALLAERRDARARNTSLGSRSLLSITRIRTAGLHVDALLLSELTPLRRLVRSRVVELVQAVLRHAKQLHRGGVLGSNRGGLRVLSLARLRRLSDRLVQSHDAIAESLELVPELGDALLHLLDRGLQAIDLALELTLLVLRLVELGLAPLLLLLVLLLLLLQQDDHVVDHLDDLLEPSLLPHERKLDQTDLRRVLRVLQVRERREGLVAHVAVVGHLEQARRREGLLEEIQRIVVVQDLDGLRDGDHLFRAALLARLVVRLRSGAALLQLSCELLVLRQSILRIRQVVLQVHDLHCERALALQLRLDRLRRLLDLLLLRARHRVELRNRGVLLRSHVSQLLLHVLKQLLQDAHNLPRRRRVARRRRQELRQRATGVLVDVLARQHELAKSTSSRALQEAPGHALLDRSDGLLARRDVRLRLGRLLVERPSLLLTLLRRRVDRRLRLLAILLVLVEIRIVLLLRANRLLDRRLDLRNLLLRRGDAVGKLLRVCLAVAHVLLSHLLVLLTILLNLLHHHLKEVHDPADRVLGQLLLAADCSCLYSCETEQKCQDAHVVSLRCG